MKKIVLVFALLFLGSSAFVLTHAAGNTETKSKIVILRVTSSNPDEAISFDASYLLGNQNGKLTHAALKTPFEIKSDAEFVNGMFQKTAGDGDMQVTVSKADEKSETRLVLGSSDNIVIISAEGQFSKDSKKIEYRHNLQAYSKQ